MSVLPPAFSAALTPRKGARHAKPSAVAPALAAGGLTVAVVVADGALLAGSSSAAAPPSSVGRGTASADDFARLRMCESGGNYRIATGNGYYGAYQFAPATWRGLGFSGLPHQASPATQDAAAAKLQAQRGWSPWPGCARKLGLGASSSAAHAAPRKAAPKHAAAPARSSRSRVTAPRTAPALDRSISLADRSAYRLVVAQWQARMKERGWTISVDGYFGPQSASVAQRFAAEKGLRLGAGGAVDRVAYTAAWTAPVT